MEPISTCYSCGAVLDDNNKSFEHIIPNSIGGIEGSCDLLCRNCNTKFGLEIEGSFAKSLNSICALLQVKRDRNKIPHIKNLTDDEGNLYYLENGRKPVRVKPIIERHDDHYSITARSWEEARHIIQRLKEKEPTLDVKNWEQKVVENKERLQKPLNFPLNVGGETFFRTVAKIAVNAYLFYGGDKKYIADAVQYITTGLKPELNGFIHYHVEPDATMLLEPLEVCHCIYIKGDLGNKVLFVYIELFNALSFAVKLSDNFEGGNFEKTYCIDILEGEQISKTITLKYPEGASPDGYKAHDPVFFPVMQSRMSRLMKIADIRQTKMTFSDELAELWKECQENYNDDSVNNENQSNLFLDKVTRLIVDLVYRRNKT